MEKKIKFRRIVSALLALLMILGGINLDFGTSTSVEAASEFPNKVTLKPTKLIKTPKYTVKSMPRKGGYGSWGYVGYTTWGAEEYTDGENVLFCVELTNYIGYNNGKNPSALNYTAYGSPKSLDKNIREFIQYSSYRRGLETWDDFLEKYNNDISFLNYLQLGVWEMLGQLEVDRSEYIGRVLEDFKNEIPGLRGSLQYDTTNHKWKEGVNVIKNTGSGRFAASINPNPTFNATNGVTGKIALNGDLTINVPKSALDSGFSFHFYHPRIANSDLRKQEYRNPGDGQRMISVKGTWDRWDLYQYKVESQATPVKLQKSSEGKALTDLAKYGYSLEGAEYGLYKSKADALSNKNQVAKFVAKADGSTNEVEAAAGKYWVKEIKAPKGFYLDKVAHEVEVKSGESNVFKVSDKPKFDPLALMLKKNTEDGKPLAGAEFEVKFYNGQLSSSEINNASPVRRWLFRTDANGVFSFREKFKIGGDSLFTYNGEPVGLIGTYTFKEIKAPKGYQLSDELLVGYVREDGSVTDPGERGTIYKEPTAINKSQKGKFDITKIDSETKKPLSGVAFSVLDSSGKVVDTLTTDAQGKASSNELALGTYTLKETKAPQGYAKLASDIKVTISGDDNGKALTSNVSISNIGFANISNGNITIKNEPQKGKFDITKVDSETNKPISGVVFSVLDSSGKVVDTLTTNAQGKAMSKELALGTYTLKETKAPQGYVKLASDIKVTISGDDSGKALTSNVSMSNVGFANISNGNITIKNRPQKMTFELNKKDFIGRVQGQNSSLAGAVYKVIAVEIKSEAHQDLVGQVVDTITTDANGVAKLKQPLGLGTYDIVEVKNSPGYQVNEVAVRVQGVSDDLGGELTTKVQQKTLNVKTLEDIYNKKVDELNALNSINAGGKPNRVLEHIEGISVDFEISSNPKVVTAEMPEYGRISVTKHQDGQSGLDNSSQSGDRGPEANIRFDIFDWNGKKVDSFVTDASGRGSSKWLPRGTYTVKQATHNPGFIDIQPFDVEIKGDWTEHQFNLENYANLKWLQIFKKDAETGKSVPQAGVKFELYEAKADGTKGNKVVHTLRYPEDKEISVFETNSKGMVQLPEKVKVGKYILEEIKAPKGYYLDPQGEPLAFEIEDDGDKPAALTKLFVVEKKNRPQKGQLVLEKTAPLLKGFEKNKDGVTVLDMQNGFLAGTKWELRAKEDIISGDKVTVLHKKGDLVDTITTKADGAVISKEVPLGKYTLKEVSVPKQYVQDTRTYDIEFTPQVQTVRVHSVTEMKFNERKNIEFEFTKKFEENPYFTTNPKADFGIFLAEDYKENGVTIPKDSMLDKVTVEAKELNGEKQVEKPIYETVEKEVIRYEVSEFVEKKVDDKDKPIIEIKKDYTYVLSYLDKETNKEVILTFDTAEEADAALAEQGDNADKASIVVNVEETKVVTGYEQKVSRELVKVFKFNDKAQADAKAKEIEDKGNIASLEAVKTIVEEQVQVGTEKVQGSEYVVKGKFKKLPIDGKFYIKELSVDGEYVLDDKKHETGFEFEDTEDKENKVDEAEIENELQKVSVVIVKTEMGSNKEIPVSGAKYKLIAVDEIKGEIVVGEYVTDELGKINIEGLPKGRYYLEEVSAPEGYFKDEEKVNVDLSGGKHGDVIEVEHENEKIPHVNTTAEDANTGKKHINPTEKVFIRDYAYYKDLIAGKEYVMKGVLMDKATNKPLLDKNGNKYEVSTKFIPESRNGYVALVFGVNASDIRGKTTVVFEDLYRDGRLLYSHADINDKEQTVRVGDPKIGTTFSQDGEKVLHPYGVHKITDRVEYKDLVVGEEYTLKLVAMDKSTGKPFVDNNGNKITAEKKFIADSENGFVNVEVLIDLASVRGKELVAFEELIYKGEVIAEHKDINDEGQTIKIVDPKVETKFADIEGGKEVDPTGIIKFVDHVSYKDLIIGKKYTAKLTVMDKSTGKPLLDKFGHTYVGETTFIAEKTEGTIEVSVDIDVKDLRGKELVAFEKLMYEGIELAAHEDINDEGQTVKVTDPKVETKFADIKGNKEVDPTGVIKFVDSVSYKDLVVGREYTVKLVVMNKETNQPLLDKDGNPYVGETTFIAETKDGVVEVSVDIDVKDLRGKELVAFEKLMYNDIEIAAHEDINDEGQTVKVTDPKVGTKAKFEDGKKETVEGGIRKIVDTVEYSNLIPGQKYKVVGWLVFKHDGSIATEKVEVIFTPETPNGSVDVVFTINTDGLGGKELVAFEELYHIDEEHGATLIAEHKDINDEGQTVRIIKKPSDNPKMGDTGVIMPATMGLTALAGLAYVSLKKKKEDEE